MNDTDAHAKVLMLRRSVACLIYGLLGFIPIVGFGFSVAALRISGLARKAERQFWNAARPQRLLGVTAAAVSMILWSFILILVVWEIVNK